VKTKFWKMSGAGNDFVLLNARPKGLSGPTLARALCDRRRSIGADGLLILTRRKGRVHLDYWNADGSSAFCGNGSRCAALWAKANGWMKGKDIILETNRGHLQARLTSEGRAEVTMPAPKGLRPGLSLKVGKQKIKVHFVDTGVPHAVVFVPDITKTEVKELGRAIRFDKVFGKPGANVDFVQIHKKILLLRTYERGVEDETLACGTGVVAAAFVARVLGHGGSPVSVMTSSGDHLSASFDSSTRLEGPGEVTYIGEVDL
jgi:diaminopimelate epimerase